MKYKDIGEIVGIDSTYACKIFKHSGLPSRNEKELKTKVVSHMRKLQKQPKRIAKYFKHPRINYAA